MPAWRDGCVGWCERTGDVGVVKVPAWRDGCVG